MNTLTALPTTPFALPYLTVISCEGADSVKFLQGQTTCELSELPVHGTTFGAICSPKGRMIASFLAFKHSDTSIWLVLETSIADSTLAHLKKYAVFFKTELAHQASYCVGGKMDESAQTTQLATQIDDTTYALSFGITGSGRALTIHTADGPTYTEAHQNSWRIRDIETGLYWLDDTHLESLIPQMVNLQAIDGISFSKGCYTGQEIIARMKFLGQLKKRMYHITLDASSSVGASLFLPDSEKKVGEIIKIVQKDNNNSAALAILNIELATQTHSLVFEGGSAEIQPLPYEVD